MFSCQWMFVLHLDSEGQGLPNLTNHESGFNPVTKTALRNKVVKGASRQGTLDLLTYEPALRTSTGIE